MSQVNLTRVVDAELDELLPALPALAIEGAKGVGKTHTARRRAGTVHALDAPGALELFEADPTRLILVSLRYYWTSGNACRPVGTSSVERWMTTPRRVGSC